MQYDLHFILLLPMDLWGSFFLDICLHTGQWSCCSWVVYPCECKLASLHSTCSGPLLVWSFVFTDSFQNKTPSKVTNTQSKSIKTATSSQWVWIIHVALNKILVKTTWIIYTHFTNVSSIMNPFTLITPS